MIRAYGSQNVRGDSGRIKIRPYNMIRAYGSQWMRLKKVSTIFNHYLKHTTICKPLLAIYIQISSQPRDWQTVIAATP